MAKVFFLMDYNNSIRHFFFISCKYVGTKKGALILGQIAFVANQPGFHREKLRKETDRNTQTLMDLQY
jgi:hypothetical protein